MVSASFTSVVFVDNIEGAAALNAIVEEDDIALAEMEESEDESDEDEAEEDEAEEDEADEDVVDESGAANIEGAIDVNERQFSVREVRFCINFSLDSKMPKIYCKFGVITTSLWFYRW